MSENLRDRYREGVIDALVMSRLSDGAGTEMAAFYQAADAVLAVRDDVLAAHQEQIETYYRASQEWLRIEAEQKAEIERWRGEYGKQHDRADRIQSNTAALYGRAHDAEARAHIAEAEVARLRETVDRVEARVAAWEDPDWGGHLSAAAFARAIRAALAPRPSATEAPRTRDGEPLCSDLACGTGLHRHYGDRIEWVRS